MIDKTTIVCGVIILTLVPVGFKFEEMFRQTDYGIIGLAVSMGGFLSGMATIMVGLDVSSPLAFLHQRDDEIIERLDEIEKRL